MTMRSGTKIAAAGPAAGILIGATLIRALIVPAIVTVMGRWNWWLPRTPGRLLRVPRLSPPRRPPRAADARLKGSVPIVGAAAPDDPRSMRPLTCPVGLA